MKTLFAVLLFAASAVAVEYDIWHEPKEARQLIGDPPGRRIADQSFDLRPLYTFWTRDLRTSKQIRPPRLDNWRERRFLVRQIFTDALLVSVCHGPKDEPEAIRYVLVHHPEQKTAVDHQIIHALVYLREDRYQYHTLEGSIATVAIYDYGMPYDPAKQLAGNAKP